MDILLIDLTLKEIAKDYQPWTLPWMKVNSLEEWRRMLILEQRINRMALGGNLDGLRRNLNEYQSLMQKSLKRFRETQNLGTVWAQSK